MHNNLIERMTTVSKNLVVLTGFIAKDNNKIPDNHQSNRELVGCGLNGEILN